MRDQREEGERKMEGENRGIYREWDRLLKRRGAKDIDLNRYMEIDTSIFKRGQHHLLD